MDPANHIFELPADREGPGGNRGHLAKGEAPKARESTYYQVAGAANAVMSVALPI